MLRQALSVQARQELNTKADKSKEFLNDGIRLRAGLRDGLKDGRVLSSAQPI